MTAETLVASSVEPEVEETDAGEAGGLSKSQKKRLAKKAAAAKAGEGEGEAAVPAAPASPERAEAAEEDAEEGDDDDEDGAQADGASSDPKKKKKKKSKKKKVGWRMAHQGTLNHCLVEGAHRCTRPHAQWARMLRCVCARLVSSWSDGPGSEAATRAGHYFVSNS